MAQLLNEVRNFDWAAWAIEVPDRRSSYDPKHVPAAFDQLALSLGREGYRTFLNAIGHDHSGGPYPSMVPGSAFLARLVPLLPMPQAAAAMDAMADVVGWTWNEAHFIDPDGSLCAFGLRVRQEAQRLLRLARKWIFEGDDAQRFAAVELMEILADIYPPG